MSKISTFQIHDLRLRDNVGKKEHYAVHGICEYVRFDPLAPYDPKGPLLVPTLQAYWLA